MKKNQVGKIVGGLLIAGSVIGGIVYAASSLSKSAVSTTSPATKLALAVSTTSPSAGESVTFTITANGVAENVLLNAFYEGMIMATYQVPVTSGKGTWTMDMTNTSGKSYQLVWQAEYPNGSVYVQSNKVTMTVSAEAASSSSTPSGLTTAEWNALTEAQKQAYLSYTDLYQLY